MDDIILNKRINSPEDLNIAKETILSCKENKKEKIFVCTGGGCIASGSLKVRDALVNELKNRNMSDTIAVIETGCLGPCAVGPVVVMGRDDTFYQNVKADDAASIVHDHIIGNKIVDRLIHETADAKYQKVGEVPFFKNQKKLVLNNCGKINPNKISDYIAAGGYSALCKVITSMTGDQTITEVGASGLRGRGGAGFPTGTKWSFARKSEGDVKYILCNADEGDPGAFMDRSILEGDPHSVVEGLAIGAFAIGCKKGFVYVRAEYPLAVERLQNAISQARTCGLLGKNILGTQFEFDLEIRMGSGAFVCGEETALMASIEGKRGEPRPRPPFPAQKGLWDKPTVLNNVETYSNIPQIINKGAPWFASVGTTKSKGTKIFALAGAIELSGLVEVPVGTPLKKIIYDIGGGIPDGKKYKAAQIGGPSGGCIPTAHLDVALDYETLNELGAIMGSGGLIVMDESSCMVDVARFFLEFVQDESCGKCVPCREGTHQMLEILNRICEGKGEMSDLDTLQKMAVTVKNASLCGLGQTASNPVLSTIRHFREEYEEHIQDKKCRAAVCKSLIVFEITDKCIGCGLCRKSCPVGAIIGSSKTKHIINTEMCTRCGLCYSTCKFDAIIKH